MKNNLKEMRLRAGLSQVELAEKLNSTQGMIGLLERGERKLAPEWLKNCRRYFLVRRWIFCLT